MSLEKQLIRGLQRLILFLPGLYFAFFYIVMPLFLLWGAYSSGKMFYEQQLLPVMIVYICFHNFSLQIAEEQKFFKSRLFIEPSFYQSSLLYLSTFNCFIFLFYFGYKTIWYYSPLLYLLGIWSNVVVFELILEKVRLIRVTMSRLQYVLLPIFGVLLWYFV